MYDCSDRSISVMMNKTDNDVRTLDLSKNHIKNTRVRSLCICDLKIAQSKFIRKTMAFINNEISVGNASLITLLLNSGPEYFHL